MASHKKEVQSYIDGVLKGKIVAGRLVKLAVQRHVLDLKKAGKRGYVFDEPKANEAIDFAAFCNHSKGEWAGKPLILEPFQKFIVWCLFGWRQKSDGMRRFRKAFISMARKGGKGLALDTPIPIPSGWTTMGELNLGDFVFDERGRQCRVVDVSEDRNIDCYEVQFSNGENVTCDGDHLWKTTARVDAVGGRRGRQKRRHSSPSMSVMAGKYAVANLWKRQIFLGKLGAGADAKFDQLAADDLLKNPIGVDTYCRVRDTRELLKTKSYGARGDRNHSIAMPSPIQMPAIDLPIHPYVLGAWLGDGTSLAPAITCGDNDVDFMSEKIVECGYSVSLRRDNTAWRILLKAVGERGIVKQNSPANLKKTLRRIGVLGNKHIPPMYLRASVSQRLDLLRGLLDTDGYVSVDGKVINFDTTCEWLRDGVAELLASLGVKFSVVKRTMRCNGRNVDGHSWRFQFCMRREEMEVFSMPRKLVRQRTSDDGWKIAPRSRTLQIKDIAPVASTTTRCIAVDSESRMFLCGKSMIPTHNSVFCSYLALLLFAFDNPLEAGAEIYVAATKEQQACIIHSEAARMVRQSPSLKKLIVSHKNNLSIPSNDSFFRPLGSDSDKTDGLNPHGVFKDELHAWQERHRGLHEKLSTGGASRRQPLEVTITTAGDDKSVLWKEENDFASRCVESVINGDIVSDTQFAFVACIDKDDDPFDEANWPKANPNLGVSCKLAYLREKANDAQKDATKLNQFLRYYCNIQVSSTEKAIDAELWKLGAGPLSDLTGRECHGGFDLGRSRDFAAIAVVVPFDDTDADGGECKRFELKVQSWTCEKAELPLENEPFRSWIKAGLLKVSDNDDVDFADVEATILAWSKLYDVKTWAYDPTFAQQMGQNLLNVHGLQIFPFTQTARYYNEPIRKFLTALRSGLVRHGNDSCLTWQAGNLCIRKNAKDEWMPDKGDSLGKIDGMVSVLMAYSECLFAEKSGPSIYSSPGELAL